MFLIFFFLVKENYFMDFNYLENMFNGWISVCIY